MASVEWKVGLASIWAHGESESVRRVFTLFSSGLGMKWQEQAHREILEQTK